jgi:hypothetical protein
MICSAKQQRLKLGENIERYRGRSNTKPPSQKERREDEKETGITPFSVD